MVSVAIILARIAAGVPSRAWWAREDSYFAPSDYWHMTMET
jgi:hypothetical protein